MRVREPAVAGAFYPAAPGALRDQVAQLLGEVAPPDPGAAVPKALIAPHAGYVYSGPVAARAYACLAPQRASIRRVVLLGPAHRVPLRGIAFPGAEGLRTPLGVVPVDRAALAAISDLSYVGESDLAHAEEHSLEVHLPFLQSVLDDFTVVPLVVGEADDAQVAEVIERLWGGPETLVVVSSDLSHYLPYEEARRADAATCRAIEELRPTALEWESACGRHPVRGLLVVAQRRGLAVETLDLRSSGDTAGPRDRVVGYGAWRVVARDGARPEREPREADDANEDRGLLALARHAIEHGLRHGEAPAIDLAALPESLRRQAASFVTLHDPNGALRGCIGNLSTNRPLAQDVADNAFKAAFRDHRFAPLRREELPGLAVAVSVLGAPEPLDVDSCTALCRVLRPGRDGLIVEDGPHRATFLPEVWTSLPDPREFVGALWRKAGLPPDHWSGGVRAWRYAATKIGAG